MRELELKIVENLVEHSFHLVLPVELTVPKSKLSDLFIHYSRFGLGFGFFGSKLLNEKIDKVIKNIGEEIGKGDNVRISVGIHILPTPTDHTSSRKIITTKRIISCIREGEVCFEYSSMSRYNSDNIVRGLLIEEWRIEKRFIEIDTSTILSRSITPFTKLIRNLWLDYEREDNA